MKPKRERLAGVDVLHRPGTGVPLVLLHGIGSDAASWASMMAALDPEIEVLAWDAPGYGQSAPLPDASPTPAHYAAVLAAILDFLGWDHVVLAGHSLGALFAARFAVMHPARVLGLALLSPALGYGVEPGATLPPSVQARIDDLDSLGPAVFAAKRAPRLIFRPEARPNLVAGARRAMAAVNPAGYAQAVRALGAGKLLEDAANITIPSLVAVGVEDVVTPTANARAVHDALRNPGPLMLVPDAGHALPQEAPVLVANLLTELCRG